MIEIKADQERDSRVMRAKNSRSVKGIGFKRPFVQTFILLCVLTVGGDKVLLSFRNSSRVTISLPGDLGRGPVARGVDRDRGVAS